VVFEDTGFNELLSKLLAYEYNTFPVLNKNNQITGLITLRDIRPILHDKDLAPLLVASDVMSETVFYLEPHETMSDALRKLEIDDYELLPVVKSGNTLEYMGVLTRDTLMRHYTKKDLIQTEG